MKRFRFTKDNLKERTEIHFCIACGHYCTHEHHIIETKNNGNSKSKNKVWICKPCHKKLSRGLIKIPLSKLSIETVNYIKDKKIVNDCVDWNK